MGWRTHSHKDRNIVVGIGSALVDILSWEKDAFLETIGGAKGGMTLVDDAFIQNTLKNVKGDPYIVSGGSACNTTIGIGKLGGRARFVGKLGDDPFGNIFRADLIKNNVEPALIESTSPTGRVLSIITPDAERTMFTYLGAAAETTPDDIRAEFFSDAAVVHIEGYLLFNTELMMAALAAAKEAGADVSLDLASYTVVEAARTHLDKIVDESVDILIANEDEARAFTGRDDDATALEALAQRASIAILKVGARGSYIAYKGDVIDVDAGGAGGVVDTTGAGDLWAAGFLYGLVNGYSMEHCGRIASACGYEVCRVVGANIPEKGWGRIRQMIDNLSRTI